MAQLSTLGGCIMRNTIPIIFAAATVLVGCNSTSSVHTQTAAPTTVQKGSREGLEFLADIPSMKDVSLKMSEAEFLDILHRQKLDYTRGFAASQTTYDVPIKDGGTVIFMFRDGHCSGIQRISAAGGG
jgi:hypothetical protein